MMCYVFGLISYVIFAWIWLQIVQVDNGVATF